MFRVRLQEEMVVVVAAAATGGGGILLMVQVVCLGRQEICAWRAGRLNETPDSH